MELIEDGRLGVATMAGPYGAFIAVLNDAQLEREILQEVDLYPLLDMARESGCSWLYLDKDADPIEGLPDYEDLWT
jgi:hypothetical protein